MEKKGGIEDFSLVQSLLLLVFLLVYMKRVMLATLVPTSSISKHF